MQGVQAVIVPAGHIVVSGHVRTKEIVFPDHCAPMAIASVKEKIDQFTHIKTGEAYPLPLGAWQDGRFHLWDGRHRYIAALMLARETMLVAWIEKAAG